MYLGAVRYNEDSKLLFANRIRATCEAHLVWVFEIADSNETWGSIHSIGGAKADQADQTSTSSRAIQGAFEFLKMYLYLSTWKEEWKFVLELLHLKIDQWLSYLKSTQHMSNLWVEKEDVETFRPHNTTSRDGDDITKAYPRYELSDFALLWLALLQIEKMIELIEDELHAKSQKRSDSTDSMIKEVRQCFASYQDVLSLEKVRANVIKTFKISSQTASGQFAIGEKSSVSTVANYLNDPQSRFPHHYSGPTESKTQYKSTFQAGTASEQHQQFITVRRTIHQDFLDVQAADFATIEASVLGIFKGSEDQAEAEAETAWRETLILQSQDITSFEDPRRLALTMFASHFKPSLTRSVGRKDEAVLRTRLATALYDSGIFASSVVRDTPRPIRDWSAVTFETASLLLAGLFKECREIL